MPVNPDVITQPQPDAKPSVKAKIKSRFPRFKKGEQTPREVLEEAAEADSRLEVLEPQEQTGIAEEIKEESQPVNEKILLLGIANGETVLARNNRLNSERDLALAEYLKTPELSIEHQRDYPAVDYSGQRKKAYEEYRKQLPLNHKMERPSIAAALKAKGVQDSQLLFRTLEEYYVGSVAADMLGRSGNRPFTSQELNTLASFAQTQVFEQILKPGNIELFKSIPNVGLSMSRLSELGGNLNFLNQTQERNIQLLTQLGTIPEEQFRERLKNFGVTSSLWPNFHQGRYNGVQNNELSSVIEILALGSIPPLLQKELDAATTLSEIQKRDYRSLPFSLHDKAKDVLDGKTDFSDALTLVQEMMRDARQRNTDGRIQPWTDYSFSPYMDLKNIDTHELADMIKQGWILPHTSPGGDELYRNILAAKNVSDQFNDPEKLQNFQLVEALFQELPMGDSQRDSSELMSLANAKYAAEFMKPENIKVFESLAELSKSFSSDPEERKHLVRSWVHVHPKGGFWINNGTFSLSMQKLEGLDLGVNKDICNFFKNQGIGDQIFTKFLLSNMHEFPTFVQNGQATEDFFDRLVTHVKEWQAENPDYYSESGIGNTKNIFRPFYDPSFAPNSLKDISRYLASRHNYAYEYTVYKNFDKWRDFFKDGIPQPSLFSVLSKDNRAFSEINTLLTQEVIDSMPEGLRDLWAFWKSIPEESQNLLGDNIEVFENLDKKSLDVLPSILEGIKDSTSKEMHRLAPQIFAQVIQAENPSQAFEEIRKVFETNNLPPIGKIYKVFEIIHKQSGQDGVSEFQRKIDLRGAGANLSPILLALPENERYGLIYKDLLRVHIDSGNRQLFNYLHILREGEGLLKKVDAEGLSGFSPTDNAQLSQFFNKLDALFVNSQYGQRKATSVTAQGDLEVKLQALRQQFGVQGNEGFVKRITAMYLRPLGFSSIEQALDQMRQAKTTADQRNRQFVESGQRIKPKQGDILKGFDSRYIGEIFQDGSVAKEFLGSSADTDMTPFDTDVSMILDQNPVGLSEEIGQSLAKGYGDMIMFMRDRGQFTDSPSGNASDRGKYELFRSGFAGQKHYGIRTGFPSTEIDAIVFKGDTNVDADKAKVGEICFEISQNGFYIPIVDTAGNVIFSPEQYDNSRQYVGAAKDALINNFTPTKLIDAFKESDYLSSLFEESAGVAEGYSLERHTNMTMTQYERYFADKWKSPLLTQDQFRVFLALHDIGKPNAFKQEHHTSNQHEFTFKLVPAIVEGLGFDPRTSEIITGMASQDYIGQFMQGNITVEKAAAGIQTLAHDLGVPKNELMNLLELYFQCDASAYTVDAGGVPSLDRLFVFNRETGADKGDMTLSDTTREKMDILESRLYSQ